jgi:hypothetical protein
MKMEIDDDFADEIVVANLADSYASISEMLKNGKGWHEDDVVAWEELLPAIKVVGAWYCLDFDKAIKNVGKKKK